MFARNCLGWRGVLPSRRMAIFPDRLDLTEGAGADFKHADRKMLSETEWMAYPGRLGCITPLKSASFSMTSGFE